jgi:hypothetical protein
MVRTAGLLSFPRRVPRFATPGRPEAAAACYVALWRLPRPDSHRLVIRTSHGAPSHSWAAARERHLRPSWSICVERLSFVL